MRLIILGSTGSLGTDVLRHALGAGHDVSVLVRDRSRLPAEARQRVVVHTGDLSLALPPDRSGQHALINCAGNVADGERLVGLVDRVIASVESLPAGEQPVCWFLAGAALLDIDASGRRGIQLPKLKSISGRMAPTSRASSARHRLALAVPGTDGRPAAARAPEATYLIDRLPVEVPALLVRFQAARSAGIRFPDSPDDRAVRRRGSAHARQPGSRQRHGEASRRTRAAGGHARSQAGMDARSQQQISLRRGTPNGFNSPGCG